ncbi:taste receptor type 2 member 3-like [Dromiciops gliroides]|uniref:taste receptor type 2 member 3-like n=1 Tax=Dromiciops gliroides TaxID=33562 RepID=UPI001CC5A7DB|nr:taste receptor type 2 member 3-like [Dromiciops gliroides]
MTSLTQRGFVFVMTIELILGICCNGFIWLMNCINLIKSKKMSLSEFVITSLAISRICLLLIIIADIFVLCYSNLDETSITLQIINTMWTFANFVSIWLATCLSILYCLKIANLSHHVFLWFKGRVSHVVRWILLASVLFSFFISLTLIKDFSVSCIYKQMTPTANCTEDMRKKKSANFLKYLLIALWMVIPFIMSLISHILIIHSLRRHTQQMQNNGTGSRDPSTEAHTRATKIILSFLFLFTVYVVAFFIIMFGSLLPDTKLAWITGEMFLAVHPFVHSIILIFSNNKLKQAFLGMFQIKK